ncbi:MAG: glycosyltransferase [Bryobacterales bacterium]|nr:glycosyltransferase [Bryobacterales bacterium]
MPPPRIAILTTGLARGGAEAQVTLLAETLSRRGWAVRVYSMLPPTAFVEELLGSGIQVENLDMRRGVADPRAVFRLAKSLRRFKPHVMHCHMVHANLLGRVSRLLVHVPALICTAHSVWEGGWWRDWAYRLTDPLSDLTTNVSRAGLTRYIDGKLAAEGKAAWVPNGVDVSHFAPDKAAGERIRMQMGWDDFVWLAVGNLREPKDYPNLLRAFVPVAAREPRALLAIAGSGQLRASLESLAAELGIGGSVRFLGAREDVRELLQAVDGYVLSSAWEGTPMALLEACACGVPVVATRVGGNPDVVEDGVSGSLIEPRNSEALGDAMLKLMALPEGERGAMGSAARKRVESTFSHEKIVDKWENIYEQMMQTSSRTAVSRVLTGARFRQ